MVSLTGSKIAAVLGLIIALVLIAALAGRELTVVKLQSAGDPEQIKQLHNVDRILKKVILPLLFLFGLIVLTRVKLIISNL
ncbi:hypothetical protein [Pelotomaculum propionicicum]|uniref:hypothetical protein n=1 Tax=Pelotomaculum propionicicum TaxID=258475 RepID=UPI003BA00C00